MIALRVFICVHFGFLLMSAEVHLRGTISNTSLTPNELVLELRPAAGQPLETNTTSPSLNGQFEFSNVKPGHYVLSVKNHHGETLKDEYFWANGSNTEVNIRLEQGKTEKMPESGNGTVNLRRLNHKVPKAAQKAMQRYRKCHEKKDEACAMLALDEALTADADYLEAYVNRSALRARKRAWDAALQDIEMALKLDPNCTLAHANRAFVAVHRQDFKQAIVSANAALRSEPGNVNALYFRALAQVNLGQFDQGFGELEKLAPDYEPARLSLAQAEPQRARLAALKARRKVEAATFTKTE